MAESLHDIACYMVPLMGLGGEPEVEPGDAPQGLGVEREGRGQKGRGQKWMMDVRYVGPCTPHLLGTMSLCAAYLWRVRAAGSLKVLVH